MVIVDANTARVCSCMQQKKMDKLFKTSQITPAFKSKTFENFDLKGCSKTVHGLLISAKTYANNFQNIKTQEDNWIAFSGEPGAGKTHLSLAIGNKLLGEGISVLYFQHVEGVNEFLNAWDNKELINAKLEHMKKVEVLIWDDLFKPVGGEVNKTEKKIAFEVLNYRYLNLLPTIISSERTVKELCQIDIAIGSRIAERSNRFLLTVSGLENNYRLKKRSE